MRVQNVASCWLLSAVLWGWGQLTCLFFGIGSLLVLSSLRLFCKLLCATYWPSSMAAKSCGDTWLWFSDRAWQCVYSQRNRVVFTLFTALSKRPKSAAFRNMSNCSMWWLHLTIERGFLSLLCTNLETRMTQAQVLNCILPDVIMSVILSKRQRQSSISLSHNSNGV